MNEIEETASGYLVSLPIADGAIRLAFEQIEQAKSHQIEVDLTVWQEIAGTLTEPFSARLNILSLSARDTYRRGLDEQFGKGVRGEWTKIMNRACSMVKAAWQNRDFGQSFEEIEDPGPLSYVAKPWVLEGLPTILFGAGGSGKTTIALAVARSVARGEWLLGSHCRESNVLYVDYEATGPTLKRRLLAMGEIPSTLDYWPAKGIPLSDQVKALERKVQRDRIGFMVVDSAAFACGGDALKQEVATAYFNALARLGIASLTVAHVTKADEDQYPFGSVFWHNGARMTWNVKASQGDDALHIGLFNRKANEERLLPPRGVRISFNGTTHLSHEEMFEDFEGHLGLPKRIHRLLQRRAMSTAQVSQELGAKEDTVGRTIRRMVQTGEVTEADRTGRAITWALRTDREGP